MGRRAVSNHIPEPVYRRRLGLSGRLRKFELCSISFYFGFKGAEKSGL